MDAAKKVFIEEAPSASAADFSAAAENPAKNLFRVDRFSTALVGRGFHAAATMVPEQYFEAGEGAKAV
jgi:hypothetical protein